MKPTLSRRDFLGAASLAGAALSLELPKLASAAEGSSALSSVTSDDKPAVAGGKPRCTGSFPAWPVSDQNEEKALLDVLHSGHWYRGSGNAVARFEEAYAKLTGAKHCLATSCGTNALYTVLGALEISPGD